MKLELNDRERDMIIAALRLWQQVEEHEGVSRGLVKIAEGGRSAAYKPPDSQRGLFGAMVRHAMLCPEKSHAMLCTDEIDELIEEKINR